MSERQRSRPAGTRPAPRTASRRPAARAQAMPVSPVASLTARATALTAGWGPTTGRILLGLVLAWFGYHELIRPRLWTGYVPVVSAQSSLAILLVLAHGLVLFVLAVALVAGIVPRIAAAATAVLVLEIVISLAATAGLSDLTLRDVGVLGLAVGLTGATEQRLRLLG